MVCRIDPLRMIALGLVLLLILPCSTQAHNGAVAIAVPVEGIVVDGDLSDWPVEMQEYPITTNQPKDEEDFRGFFRIGYSASENALYLSVEMRDDSVVLAEDGQWNTADGCEVYVDAVHALEGDRPTDQFKLFGNPEGIYGSEGTRGDFGVAVRRTDDSHWYEWRIDLERMTGGQVRLRPGMSLGVDVV
jgi:hypothetical protein